MVESIEFIRDTVADNLKRIRKGCGLSMDQLADMAGVSKSLVGQIERGETSPSIANLWKIAVGLQVPFTLLLETHSAETQIVNKADLDPLNSDDDRFHLYPFFPARPGQDFEILFLDLEPGGQSESQPHAPGTTEYIIVSSGTMEIQAGDEVYQVSSGSGIFFAADQPHAYRNKGGCDVQAVNVIYYRSKTE